MKEAEKLQRVDRMQSKGALELYWSQKGGMREEFIGNMLQCFIVWGNGICILQTKPYWSKYQKIDSTCPSCWDVQLELIKHAALECRGLSPATLEHESGLAADLGFTDENLLIDLTRIMRTKGRLEEWWKKSWEE